MTEGRTTFEPVPGSEFELACNLVLLALGFTGPERNGVVAELGLKLDPRGALACDADWATNVEGVFVDVADAMARWPEFAELAQVDEPTTFRVANDLLECRPR